VLLHVSKGVPHLLMTGATRNLLLHVSARSDDKSYLLSLSLYAIEFTITPWYWALAIWTRGMHDFHVVDDGRSGRVPPFRPRECCFSFPLLMDTKSLQPYGSICATVFHVVLGAPS
jgi:hypothetical protein